MGMKLKIVINAYNMGICGTLQDLVADVILGTSARVAPHEFPAGRFVPYPHCSDRIWAGALILENTRTHILATTFTVSSEC